jgi:hypothetical protein
MNGSSVIIKSGSQFRPESRHGNTFDLTLDNNITVAMYPNARIQIGNVVYLYGPITDVAPLPAAANRSMTVDKNTKYHINNVEYDPIGLTKTLEYDQKVHFQGNSGIILPSETILHTLDNSLEFRLTKSIHCIYNP